MRTTAILLYAILACCLSANAQSSSPTAATDTVVIITDAKDITVTSGNGSVEVLVGRTRLGNTYSYKATAFHNDSISSDWNLDLPFSNHKHSKFKGTLLPRVSIEWGATFDQLAGFKSKGIGQGALEVGQLSWWPTLNTSLSLGLGFQWAQYYFDGPSMLTCHNGTLSFVDAPAEAKKINSTINNFSWIFPLRFYQRIYRDLGFTVGATAKVNTYATAVSSYKIDDTQYKETFKGLHQKPLTYDISASVVVDWFEVSFKYSPCNVFDNGFGPKFKGWSIGIALTF